MGFYIRKSAKAGPFRFNLSKSGIGVSAGVPGFRIGTGPRGNYVHMGRNGIYYRASLNEHRARSSPRLGQSVQHPQLAFRPSDVVMEDVTGATAMSLEPTGRGDLVDQLNAAAGRFAWWWPAGIAVFLLGLMTMPWGLAIWVVGAVCCAWLYLNDQARRTVVLFYDLHDDAFSWFDSVVTQWCWLTESQRVWRVVQCDFGVPEPTILRPDGQLNVHRLHTSRRDPIAAWARQLGLTAWRHLTNRGRYREKPPEGFSSANTQMIPKIMREGMAEMSKEGSEMDHPPGHYTYTSTPYRCAWRCQLEVAPG
nr:DUF4236 domain-containing protein [Mycobacterium malmoense]